MKEMNGSVIFDVAHEKIQYHLKQYTNNRNTTSRYVLEEDEVIMDRILATTIRPD